MNSDRSIEKAAIPKFLEEQAEKTRNRLAQLGPKISSIGEDITSKQKEFKALVDEDKTSCRIIEIIEGLERTPAMKDPGKDDTAYYYVKDMLPEDDIVPYGIPYCYHPCPACKEGVPILMSYEQIYDSPELDIWAKKAFIIHCDRITELASVTKPHRF